MKLWGFQRKIVKAFLNERFVITNKSRQIGLSTITSLYCLWLALFHLDKRIVIISIKDKDAMEFLEKIHLAHSNLPDWMQDKLVTDNAHEMEFTTRSKIESVASSTQAARGRSINLLIVDEAAFIANAESIWTSAYPTLSAGGGKAIVISTPNGLTGWFYQIWSKADPDLPQKDRNAFHRIFAHWTEVPDFRGFEPEPGMTFKEIYERAIESAWYKDTRPNFDDRKWAQEFEGDFLGSGNTVIDPSTLKRVQFAHQPPAFKMNEKLEEAKDGGLWVWKKPQPNRLYIIGADVASGSGLDSSTAQVLDQLTGEQVAEYRGKINVLDFSQFLYDLGMYYNEAYLAPEINSMGLGVVQKLIYEKGYSVIHEQKDEMTMKRKKRKFGWVTTQKTRPLLISALIHYISSGDYKWYSERLYKELVTFVWKENGKAEADGYSNDDLIIALAIAFHCRGTAMMNMPIGYEEFANADGEGMRMVDSTGETIDSQDTYEPVMPNFADHDPDLDWLRS